MIKKTWIIIALITFFAFGQRFYQIQTNPPSLNWDEISHGYNAYSILKTGADEWGTKFPLIFRAFGDYKLPLYIYLTVIPVYFLGLTPMAIRLVSVLAGTLAIPAIYLLTNQLFSKDSSSDGSAAWVAEAKRRTPPRWNPSIGLLAAFLLAISPWHFFISRPALEANLALTLIIFGFWALHKALKNPKFYLLSSILLGLSLHTYNTARVFVPLLLIAFFIIYRPQQLRRSFSPGVMLRLRRTPGVERSIIFSALIFIFSLTLVGHQVLSGTGTARYSKLAILSDNAVYRIGQRYTDSPLSPILAKLRYNRPVYFLTEFTKNYLSYFSPNFIYQIQGAQYQFAIPGKNLFTLPVTLLGLIGGAYLVLRSKSKSTYFILVWLLASPIAAALTADPPQALRPNPMIPAVIIFAAIGFFWILSLVKKYRWVKKAVFISLILSCLVGYILYLDSYYSSYLKTYSWSWQYGYQEVIKYVEENNQDYDNVIITKRYGEPHIFYAFFTKLDPQVLQPGGDSLRYQQSDWFWTDRINNTFFVNDWDIPKVLEDTVQLEGGEEVSLKNSLLIVSPQSLPENVKILKNINYINGSPAFIIVTPI